jgi:hypothetical protein
MVGARLRWLGETPQSALPAPDENSIPPESDAGGLDSAMVYSEQHEEEE